MTDSDVSLHRYGHSEVGGPSQSNLTDGEQLGEQLAVQAVGPDAEQEGKGLKKSFHLSL